MKKILKIELERAYRSRGMTVALSIGLILAVVQFFQYVYPWRNHILTFFDGTYMTYPLSVFNMWLGADDTHPWLAIYMTIFPILAALPYGASYFDDKKTGYIKNICIHVKKERYLLAKYIAVFLSSGTTVVLPMLFNLMLTASVMPSLIPSMNGLFAPGSSGMFANIFHCHPYVYIFIYLVMYFIYGGVFASIALAVTEGAEYRFIVLLSPFCIFYATGLISQFVRHPYIMEIGMRRLLTMTQYRGISEYTFFGEAFIIAIISFVIYFVRGMANDIF